MKHKKVQRVNESCEKGNNEKANVTNITNNVKIQKVVIENCYTYPIKEIGGHAMQNEFCGDRNKDIGDRKTHDKGQRTRDEGMPTSSNSQPSTDHKPSSINYKPLSSVDDQRVREALMAVCSRISRQRYWFCIYRGLVDRGLIPENNFKYFRNYIISLLGKDNLPRKINPHDLQFYLNVLSFKKNLSKWDPDNSPVSKKNFKNYYSLTFDFLKLI